MQHMDSGRVKQAASSDELSGARRDTQLDVLLYDTRHIISVSFPTLHATIYN